MLSTNRIGGCRRRKGKTGWAPLIIQTLKRKPHKHSSPLEIILSDVELKDLAKKINDEINIIPLYDVIKRRSCIEGNLYNMQNVIARKIIFHIKQQGKDSDILAALLMNKLLGRIS